MNALEHISRLVKHTVWADVRLIGAIDALPDPPAEAVREMAHIIGAEEVWLSRIKGRAAEASVWPPLSGEELNTLAERTHRDYLRLLESLGDGDLTRPISYTNSAGMSFTSAMNDILAHVSLHGQYHRGKINALLRQAGHEPAPTDYIAYVRGVPAATESQSRIRPGTDSST